MDKYQIKKFQIYSQFQDIPLHQERKFIQHFFTLECLSNNVKVIINKQNKNKKF